MKSPICFALLALPSVSSFAPSVQPAHTLACLSATIGEAAPTKLRKRDRVKKVVKNVLGMNKETAEIMDTSEGEEPPAQQNAPVRRKMLKAKSGEKYAKIDCIEEKAYQILKDLDMIEEYN